jgi:hypothetical protein
MPGPPGSGAASLARRNRTRSVIRSALAMASLKRARFPQLVTEKETNVKEIVTRAKNRPPFFVRLQPGGETI